MIMRKRKPNRLADYNYSQNGMYFVTICTKDREELFGEIKNGRMILNDLGKIAQKCYLEIPSHCRNVYLDEFIIMPNHVHGILEIINDLDVGDAYLRPAGFHDRTKMLASKAIHGFKAGVTRKILNPSSRPERIYAFPTKFAWQKSFYDHIIRNAAELNRIREYIRGNPAQWNRDRNNAENIFM